MRQWRCKLCGEWVDMTWLRHLHVQEREQSLAELHAARERGEMPDVVIGDVLTETWSPNHETREAPVVPPI